MMIHITLNTNDSLKQLVKTIYVCVFRQYIHSKIFLGFILHNLIRTKQNIQPMRNIDKGLVYVSRHFPEDRITLTVRCPGNEFSIKTQSEFILYLKPLQKHYQSLLQKLDKECNLTQVHRKSQIGRNLRSSQVQPPTQRQLWDQATVSWWFIWLGLDNLLGWKLCILSRWFVPEWKLTRKQNLICSWIVNSKNKNSILLILC